MMRRLIERRGPDPVSLVSIRDHLRVDDGEFEPAYLESLLRTATQYVTDSTWLGLEEEEWEVSVRDFEDEEITLYPHPIRSVESVKYEDTEGNEVTVDPSEYRLVQRSGVAYVEATDKWPDDVEPETVRVRYVTGFEASEVPDQARHAIRLMCAHWFAMREPAIIGTQVNEVPVTAHALIDQIAMRRFG